MYLVDAVNFKQVYNELSGIKLPVKVAYGLQKIYNSLKSDNEFYENRIREIIFNYSKKDENGSPILMNDGRGIEVEVGKRANCNQEISELYQTEITPPATVNLTLDDLIAVDGLELTIPQLEILGKFLAE